MFADEDAGFAASELNTHGPTVHGWRSAAGSGLGTHDIILRFHQPAKIYRIQLLAHQYLIRELGHSKIINKVAIRSEYTHHHVDNYSMSWRV